MTTPETPEEFELTWDAQHPEGDHGYMSANERGEVDPDSITDEPPYDTGEGGPED